jgi:hypothetical protein
MIRLRSNLAKIESSPPGRDVVLLTLFPPHEFLSLQIFLLYTLFTREPEKRNRLKRPKD